MSFRNPIIPGHNPDPSIIRHDGHYYLVTSTFEYFPALPVYRSKDLINWSMIHHAMDRPGQLNMRTVESGGGVFAPSIRVWKGRFYISCTAMYRVPNMENFHQGIIGPRGFYVWTDDINAGNWSDPVYFDTLGIDQDLFFDDDDKVYLSLATILPRSIAGEHLGIGVYVMEIDLATGRAKTTPTLIRHSKHGSGVAEGSHIFKKDGYYFLSVAEGGTEKDHQQWIFRSSTGPMGPWEEPPSGVNPILYNGDHHAIQQTGHMDLVEGDNGWWAVFLAIRGGRDGTKGWSQLGRETFLAPVEWVDGWPRVNGGSHIDLNIQAALPRSEEKCTDQLLPKSATELPQGWYFLRTPMAKDYSMTDRPGSLALYGTPYTLDVDESPAAIFQKQTAFTGTFDVKLDFHPNEGGEAGVVVWWSRRAYASLSVIATASGPSLQMKWCPEERDDFTTEQYPLELEGEISMRVTATPLDYKFSVRQASASEWNELTTVPVGCIVRNRPVDSRNVGTHFGLYAQGANGWPCGKAAYFRDAVWSYTREGGP